MYPAVLLALCGLAAAMWLLQLTRFGAALTHVGTLGPAAADPRPVPRISVAIPARNEKQDLESGVRSVLAQEGVELDVIVVNDHSTDQTGAIADRIAAEDRRVQALHDPPLEPGWLGKANAMQQGAAHASGEYLLFTDADIVHGPRCLASLVQLLRERDADLASTVPRLILHTFWDNVIVPMYVAGFAQYGTAAIDDPASPDAMASGALMLLEKEAFDGVGGMSAVRGEMFDDVGLARLLKRSGKRVVARLAPQLLQVRVFTTNLQAFWGTTKNVMMIGNGKPVLALGAVLIAVRLFWTPWLADEGQKSSSANTKRRLGARSLERTKPILFFGDDRRRVDDIAVGALEGKAKGPRSGHTTHDGHNVASALARLRTTDDPPRDQQQGFHSRWTAERHLLGPAD